MFLKPPKASTDQRVRSLLQKAARRGHAQLVGSIVDYLDRVGDKAWLRSRSVVITFEECWPLAASLKVDRELKSKRSILMQVAHAAKQKDAASLGAFAHAFHEGDRSVLDFAPDAYSLRLVAKALDRPREFLHWAERNAKTVHATQIIQAAGRYLSVATWQWDKACILAGALLGLSNEIEAHLSGSTAEEFPYWVALDKHTVEGKQALSEVAKRMNVPYRHLIWASFYFESARVNSLLPSPWWSAEARWRFQKAGSSFSEAENLWSNARSLVQVELVKEAAFLKGLIESAEAPTLFG